MQQIGDWLEKLGMSEYAQRFAANDIDISVLRHLTDQDLKELGVSLGHRRKMLAAISEFAAATATEPKVFEPEPKPQEAAERRQVTVMFSDLVGSTALSTRMDPEDLREIISAYQKCVAETVRRFDGFVAKYMGDGVLVYFGYPQAHEDDAEQAVRAGLELIAAVVALKTRAPLQTRIGIATGLVVVGDLIGSGSAQEQSVIGETPNLAARLQSLAEPGTIVIAASTLRLLGRFFALRSLGRHEFKGFDEPVEAWAVEGASSSESRFEAVRSARLTSFVGREQEVELLLDRKNLAWRGEGQVVLISGEAGIGKSRLAAWFSERVAAEPHMRLRYQCSPYHRDSALHPFIAQLGRAAEFKPDDPPARRLDKLEALLAMGTPHPQAVAPLLATLLSIPFGERYPPLTLSPAQQRRQTLAALLKQFEDLARQRPILLLFEDAHWADPTSLELLDRTVDRIGHLPVLAIFTFRPEYELPWAELPNVTRLALTRLNQSHVQTMIVQLAGGRRLPSQVTEQIISKTDGIPLFVEELTKTVLETGILVEEADRYRLDGPLPPLAIPATLHDLSMARLDRLAPIKEIAQIGAAIGREFSYPLLSRIVDSGDATLRSALAQLEEAELVFRRGEPPDAVYTFKHALVQDTAYESMLRSRRQVLHQRIGDALREKFQTIAETEPEIVAHHFTKAGLNELAVEWWGKAGERALHSSAYNEAIAHLEKALALVENLAEGPERTLQRLRLQTNYGYALLHGRGQTCAETLIAFARARELAVAVEDASERTSIYWAMWVISYARTELFSMRESADAMLSDAQRWPGSPEACIAHQVVGITRWFEGDYVSARVHLEHALAGYDPDRDRHLAARFGFDPGVLAMGVLVRVLWGLGKVDRAVHLVEQGLSFALQTAHVPSIAFAQFATCFFAALRRKPDQAAPHAQALVALAREHGLPQWLAYGTFCLGWALWCAGDREGELRMREGLEVLREQQVHNNLRLFYVLLAEVEAELGRLEVGLATLNAEHEAIERTGERWFHAEVHRVRGELLLRRQPPDFAAAAAAFMLAIDIAQRQKTRTFELHAAVALATIYKGNHQDQAARRLLEQALAGFGEVREFPEVAEANRLLASLAPLARVST